MAKKDQMDSRYVVVYKRDFETVARREEYEHKELYDRLKGFDDEESAMRYAFQNMPSVLVRVGPASEEERQRARNPNLPYVVVVRHHGKYGHYDYTGDSDPLTTYDLQRCKAEDVMDLVERMTNAPTKRRVLETRAVAGLELKLA